MEPAAACATLGATVVLLGCLSTGALAQTMDAGTGEASSGQHDAGATEPSTPHPPGEEPDAGEAISAFASDEPPPEEQSPETALYAASADYDEPPVTDPSLLEGVPGAREHDGFFVRLNVGPGAGRTYYREEVDGARLSSVETSGLSGTFDLGIGGRAVGNLIVHGNLIYTRYRSPTRRVDGVKDAAMRVKTTAIMLGAGVSYYFMPYNVFLTGSLGPSWQYENRPSGSVRTRTGGFLLLAAGKEWWTGVSGNWGLGTALRVTFAAAPVDIAGVSSVMKLGEISLAFSATFN